MRTARHRRSLQPGRSALVLSLLFGLHLAGRAHAAPPLPPPGPPPDPSRGESFDGRRPRASARSLLWLPRILLAPIRLVVKAIEWPTQRMTEWIEKVHLVRRVTRLFTSADGLIGLRPSLSYTSSFVPLFGATFFDHRFIGPGTGFELTLQGGDPRVLFAGVHLRPFHEWRAIGFDFESTYSRRDDRLFTGIGTAQAHLQPGTRYSSDEVNLQGELHLVASLAVRAMFSGQFGVRRFGDGRAIADDLPITQVDCIRDAHGACVPGTVDEALVPGFRKGTQFARAGAHLMVDSRDSRFRPTSGAAAHLAVWYTHGLGADSSAYFRFHGGLEAVLDLWNHSHVLAARVTADTLVPVGAPPVTFSELVILGGPDDLRGVRPGKYRDFSSLLFSVEYRWPVWMWMDASLFFDYGGVFGRGFANVGTEPMIPCWGGGVRLRTLSHFYGRAQVAYGLGEGVQVFVGAQVEP